MTGRKLFAIVLGVLLGSLAIGSPAADNGEGHATHAEGNERTPPERLLRSILTIYIWKMSDAVKLNEEQSARVFPLVRRNFQTRWELAMKRRNLVQRVRKAVGKNPQQESELQRLLAQWKDNEEKLYAARERLRTALTQVLTARQQAQSLLFEEEFEGELSHVLSQMRRENLQVVPGETSRNDR